MASDCLAWASTVVFSRLFALLRLAFVFPLDVEQHELVQAKRLHVLVVEHRSWWFDAKILFMTFVNIVFGKVF